MTFTLQHPPCKVYLTGLAHSLLQFTLVSSEHSRSQERFHPVNQSILGHIWKNICSSFTQQMSAKPAQIISSNPLPCYIFFTGLILSIINCTTKLHLLLIAGSHQKYYFQGGEVLLKVFFLVISKLILWTHEKNCFVEARSLITALCAVLLKN